MCPTYRQSVVFNESKLLNLQWISPAYRFESRISNLSKKGHLTTNLNDSSYVSIFARAATSTKNGAVGPS